MNEVEDFQQRERQRRFHAFNTELSQVAMEAVFAERRRQVKLGREGTIDHACEDPSTADAFRMGVLGEEYGEVCKALIERQGLERELEEYVHTSAVALACAEGIMRKLGVEPRDGRPVEEIYLDTRDAAGPEEVDEQNFVRVDALADEHAEVLLRVRKIYEERSARRGPLWRKMGARGQLVNMRTCVERLWNQFYNINPDDLEELDVDVDDALDLINYTVFLVLCLNHGSRDGEWTW